MNRWQAKHPRYPAFPWAVIVAIFLVSTMAPPALGADGRRVAFVVGIGTYDKLSADKQLKNAVHDAEGVAQKLQEIGFQVVHIHRNLGRAEFNAKWHDTLNSLGKDDTFLFFYSGHGVQIGGQNYLLPRDVPLIEYDRRELLTDESIKLNKLLADLSIGDRPHPKHSVVILDACRDDPFVPPEWKSITTPAGLAKVESSKGIFVIYSAESNRTALDRLSSDDPVKYSVFTRILLPLMGRGDLSIQDLSRELKDQVWNLAESAGRSQLPTYYDGILGRLCLPGCVTPSVSKVLPTPSPTLKHYAGPPSDFCERLRQVIDAAYSDFSDWKTTAERTVGIGVREREPEVDLTAQGNSTIIVDRTKKHHNYVARFSKSDNAHKANEEWNKLYQAINTCLKREGLMERSDLASWRVQIRGFLGLVLGDVYVWLDGNLSVEIHRSASG